MVEKEVHLRDYFSIIRKHDFIIILSFLLISGSALIVGLHMPRIYETSAVIEVQPSKTSSGISSLMQNVMSSGVDRVSLETICRRFTSRSLLSDIIRSLKKDIPDINNLGGPEALASRIQAKAIPDTRMIEVSVKLREDEGGSQLAARIANELVSVMQVHRSSMSNSEMEIRRNSIDKEIRDIENQISNLDQDMRNFLRDKGNSLVWSVRAEYVMNRLSELINRKEGIETFLVSERKKLRGLRDRVITEPEWIEYSRTFSRDPLWDKNRIDLIEKERELASSREEFGENNPRIKAIEAEIMKIKEEMKDIALNTMPETAKTESINPIRQTILDQIIESELRLISYEAQFDIVVDNLDNLKAERDGIFSKMPEEQFQLDKMRREVNYKVDMYKILMEKKLEAEMWASENSNNAGGRIKGGIEVIDLAQPLATTISPRIKFITALGGLVGLAAGLAMAFLAEYFENT
jgi:uncharacterized protein involved in exopolysaccharide biosynthesis